MESCIFIDISKDVTRPLQVLLCDMDSLRPSIQTWLSELKGEIPLSLWLASYFTTEGRLGLGHSSRPSKKFDA